MPDIYATYTCRETLTSLRGGFVYIRKADAGDTVRSSRIEDHIDGQKEVLLVNNLTGNDGIAERMNLSLCLRCIR